MKEIEIMKNHYVMDSNSVMLYRDSLEGCRQWVKTRSNGFKNYGMKPPVYRIFYDTATEPCETFNNGFEPAHNDCGFTEAL